MPDDGVRDEGRDQSRSAPVDHDALHRIGRRLRASRRFGLVDVRPSYAPNSVVLEYDLGYFPPDVDRAYLRIRWYENDDFTVHYSEQYDERLWECRWDRHPNDHNSRDHVHPPPDAATPGDDASFPTDWRDVLTEVLERLDERVERLWE